MSIFRDISGDYNPLHNDESFAVARGFNSRVVYGMLTASLYSCLGGCIFLVSDVCCKVFMWIF